MAVKDFLDEILVTTTTAGTGTLTQVAAVPPFLAPPAGANGKTFAIFVYEVDSAGNPSGAWELTESVYTHSGTTWSRGTLLNSSTGSRISFAVGTKRIEVVVASDVLLQLAFLNGKAGGQTLIGGTGGTDIAKFAANTTDNTNTTYFAISAGGGGGFVTNATTVISFGSTGAVIFNRSVEVGTDPLGAIPGPAGKFKAWTDDDGAGEPAAGTNFCILYAWDFAAGDARWKFKSESGNPITIGNGTVTADTFSGITVSTSGPHLAGSYGRVGSTSEPANITDGDLTIGRLDIGFNAAFGAGGKFQAFGIVTDTSGGSIVGRFDVNATPASNSTAIVVGFSSAVVANAAAGVTQNEMRPFGLTFVNRQTGAIALSRGILVAALTYDSSSPATPGTVTECAGMEVFPFYNNNVGGSSGSVTNLYGYSVLSIPTAGLSVTTFAGFHFENPTASTYGNIYGVDVQSINLGVTDNVGGRFAYPGVANGTGATTNSVGLLVPTAAVAMGNQTASTANACGIYVGVATYTSTTLTRTLTKGATIYVEGPPIASTNVVITNGPYSLWIDAGTARFDGDVVLSDASTLQGIATQAEQETGTSTTKAVTPGRQHFHPSAAKFWAQVTGSGTPVLSTSYNVTSIADTAIGRMTVTINVDFSSANWCCVCGGVGSTTVTSAALVWIAGKAAGSVELDNVDASATSVVEDPVTGYDVAGFGDL